MKNKNVLFFFFSTNATVRLLCDDFLIPFFKVIDATQNVSISWI